MPFHIGPWEVTLIIVLILIIFGAGKLPQVGSAIGKGLRSLRDAQNELDETMEEVTKRGKKEDSAKRKRI